MYPFKIKNQRYKQLYRCKKFGGGDGSRTHVRTTSRIKHYMFSLYWYYLRVLKDTDPRKSRLGDTIWLHNQKSSSESPILCTTSKLNWQARLAYKPVLLKYY